jgi:hypothetical protein
MPHGLAPDATEDTDELLTLHSGRVSRHLPACRRLVLEKLSLRIFKRVLVVSLANKQRKLAERIAVLDERQVHILYDHLLEQQWAKADRGRQFVMTTDELQALAEACQSYEFPSRFLHSFKCSLVQILRGAFPALASKLSRLSESEFEWLYAQVTGRRKGSH